MMKKIILVGFYATVMLMLVSCSQFSTSTNLDRSNFTHYFSSSNVTIFESEQDFTGAYRYVGLVEGEDCQLKDHHAQPNEVIARTKARKSAAKLKANAIIFTGCALIGNDQHSKQCTATTVCYGKAYFVNP
jgi:RcsF protein